MRVQLIHHSTLEGEAISRVLKRKGHDVYMEKHNGVPLRGVRQGTHLLILDITARSFRVSPLKRLYLDGCSLILLGRISQLHHLLVSTRSNLGYITKRESLSYLFECISRAPFENYYISREVGAFLKLSRLRQQQVLFRRAISNPVTRTELRVLNEIANGHTTREIAEKLYRSVYTINNHRKNMMKKLELEGPFALGTFSVENLDGILTLKLLQVNKLKTQHFFKMSKRNSEV
ncbi:MAG: LuxR C-terminal-related transcriptional regulator [Balneolaceae bacterium]|nr:LuxR C-terminal-related transcriptional regulator [Balneolaceae bacterium]